MHLTESDHICQWFFFLFYPPCIFAIRQQIYVHTHFLVTYGTSTIHLYHHYCNSMGACLKVCFRKTQELRHRQVKAHDDCYDNQFHLLDPVVDVLILSFFFYNYKV